jgi:hypothetical protein
MRTFKQDQVTEYCIKHGHGSFVLGLSGGLICMQCELPFDYEACGECGFDHAYEYDESYKAHSHILAQDEVVCSEAAIVV